MRRLLIIAAVAALTVANPEKYREKEDFQYSRSSTDEGSKSGFYGAQRGNMGGNYEKAHNMDLLAQHQMSGLVRQVQGEIGDNTKTRAGNVFTAASSRGVYGSGNFDISNLEGRNFQEGAYHGDSLEQSSLSSRGTNYNQQASSSQSAGYSSSRSQHSRYNGYQATGHSGQSLQTGNLQTADNLNGAGYDYERQGGYDSRHFSQSGYQGQSEYDRNSINQHRQSEHDRNSINQHRQSEYDRNSMNQHHSRQYGTDSQSRLISTVPVRVVLRPGIRVAVPVAAQTYDATHSATSLDQNAIHSDAEILINSGHQTFNRPTSNAKHYEASYNYHKEWEKHDSRPVDVPVSNPTVNPFPRNNEFYDETQAARISDDHYRAKDLSNDYSGYNANVKSTSRSHSGHLLDYNTQSLSSSSGFNANTHNAHQSAATSDLTKLVEDINTRPKSYQSSYSYHKSWEREGDPYVIKPVSNSAHNAQASQRLTAGSVNQGAYSSHQYGSRQSSSHGTEIDCDCDEEGHVRVARSYNLRHQQKFDTDQQGQEYDQHDMGQQTQEFWDNAGQETQSKWDNLEDLGQQTQNKWDRLEDFGQQSQNKWDNLANLGQEIQNTWDKLEQTVQNQSKQTEGQQKQEKWGNTENSGQQHQGPWDQLDIQKAKTDQEEIEINSENKAINQNLQVTTEETSAKHVSGTVQSIWDKLDSFGVTNIKPNFHNSEGSFDSHSNAEKLDIYRQNSHTVQKSTTEKNASQQVHNTWSKLNSFGLYQNTENNNENQRNNYQQQYFQNANLNHQSDNNRSDQSQNTFARVDNQSNYGKMNNNDQYSQTSHMDTSDEKVSGRVQNTWNKVNNFGSYQNTQNNKQHNSEQSYLQNLDTNHQNEQHKKNDSQNTFNRQDDQSSYGKLDSLNLYFQMHQKEKKYKNEFGQVQNNWNKINNLGSDPNTRSNKNLQNSKQETQVQTEKDNFDTFEQKQNNWHQLFQNVNLNNNGQSVSKLDSKTESDIQQHISPNNQQGQYLYSNTRYINPGSYNQLSHQQENVDSYQQIIRENADMINWLRQHSNANNSYNTHYNSEATLENSSHLQNWDKINDIQKDATVSTSNFNKTDRNEAHSSNELTSSHHSFPYHNWGHVQSYHSEGNLFQNSFQSDNLGSQYSVLAPWHTITSNLSVDNIDMGNNNQNTQVNKYNLHPMDIGRGDIESEDSSIQSSTTSEQAETVLENKLVSQTFLSNYNKQYKTPQEIKALSLTKESDKTINDAITTEKYHNTQQQSDTLNVLSINQQKRLEEEKKNGGNYNNNLYFSQSLTQTSSTTPKNNQYKLTDTENIYITKQLIEKPEINNLTHRPASSTNYEFNIENHTKHEDLENVQVNTSLEQQPKEIVEQNMEQQFEDLGQENENLDQQSQTAWDEHLEDLGQHVQTENLQQQQQLQEFGSVTGNDDQKQDFYGQTYHPTNYEEGQRNKKAQNVQLNQEKKEIEVIIPPEPTTNKPGFWTNAKNKISSWFRRS